MTQDYYVVYDLESRVPVSVSGSRPTAIEDGRGILPIDQQHGEDFVLFKKIMGHYLVSVTDDGRGDFIYRLTNRRYKKYAIPSNIVQDLNYGMDFVTNFGIEYLQDDTQLILTLDLLTKDAEQRSNFNTSITAESGEFWIYVTRRRSPTELIEKFSVNLYQLGKTRSQAFELKTREKVSVWATRKK